MQIPNVIRMAVVLAAATALAAACGVANPFAPASANSSNQDQMLKWAQCMRQHGVNVPDPVNGRITVQNGGPAGGTGGAQPSGSGGSTGDPGGDGGKVANGPDPNSAQFQAAQNACKQYAPNGAKGGGQPTQQQLDQMTKFSQCMRDHGIPMSDPQVQSGGGVSIRVSPPPGGERIDPNSDQFKQAQQACARYQPGGGPNGSSTSNG
ncbi:MAG: hypothetical protein E6J41_06185 [Chloroflexi bacterium]|nr:MAG: hypothetical protein E6J41_06185 [Chloroflexota bacterium]